MDIRKVLLVRSLRELLNHRFSQLQEQTQATGFRMSIKLS